MMKSKSSSKRRNRSPDDSKSKRVKVLKSSEREKIRKDPVDSKTKHADAPKPREKEKIRKKSDDSADAPSKSHEKEKIRKKSDDTKSKHSKPTSKSSEKGKVRENPDDSKPKHSKTPAKSEEGEKVRESTKSVPRKTRWQSEDQKDSPTDAPISEPGAKKEKSGPPPLRIKDSIHDKEKLVDLLFQTVTGTALQELIPDYLKKRSIDELKKLCVEQIKLMSDESILQILSRKVDSSNKEEKVVEKEKILKPEHPNPPKEKEKQGVPEDSEKKSEDSKKDTAGKPLGEPSQPQGTSSNDELEIVHEQNIPAIIKEEVAKELIQPNRDAELLELEMRARAIRSLLKVKSQSPNKEETSSKEDN